MKKRQQVFFPYNRSDLHSPRLENNNFNRERKKFGRNYLVNLVAVKLNCFSLLLSLTSKFMFAILNLISLLEEFVPLEIEKFEREIVFVLLCYIASALAFSLPATSQGEIVTEHLVTTSNLQTRSIFVDASYSRQDFLSFSGLRNSQHMFPPFFS